jgi:hypothetical protein
MGGDDHCILEMTFDGSGHIISSKASITMGDKSFDTGIIKAGAAAAAASQPEFAAAALLATEIGDKLATKLPSGMNMAVAQTSQQLFSTI